LNDPSCRADGATDHNGGSIRIGPSSRKIWQEICPAGRFLAVGVIGLALWASGATPCLAARETQGTDARQRTAPSGIRDPLNPQAYMQELASRLNSSQEKKTLLRGVRAPAPTGGSTTSRKPASGSTAPTTTSSDADLRRMVAEELARQERADQQAAARQEQLRRMVAEEVARIRRSQAQAQESVTPGATIETPNGPATVVTEQDLRAMIAQELSRQGLPLPGPEQAQTAVQEPTMTDPALQEPTPIEPAVQTPATQEEDLQTLIARELERRRRQEEQTQAAETEPVPVEPEPVAAPTPTLTEQDVRALIAQEVARQNQGQTPSRPQTPAVRPARTEPTLAAAQTQQPDLQMLIAEELERRRQASRQADTQAVDPYLVDTRPATSGRSSVTGLAPNNRAALRAYHDIQVQRGLTDPDEPWTLGRDLDKYRAYAVSEGSRDSGESLKKAFERVGWTLEDGVNIFALGYASDRAERFRHNDGKGLFQEPGNVPRQAGRTIVDFGDGLYSLLDLLLLDGLADKNKDAYLDNNPLVRPFVYTGKTVGGLWRTTEELGNAITWGYFDNVTGSAGMCFEDIVEVLKHTGQAVTNVARVPFHLMGAKEGTDRALDWVLLVPLELASNMVEMQGFSNMDDYKTAFADKGVIGSLLEFGGSSYIAYRAIDEIADELQDDNQGAGNTQQPTASEPPTTPVTPEPPVVEPPVDAVFYWALR
ncbi:MAG: hypothetical protein JW993_15510, partial [Sedimentisphaerales bacterium]|nr:hypothetical protein [Sedimentisphaerales bacterium]